jgi:hypothetical protein
MLARKMKRMTRNRLKEKQRQVGCYTCVDTSSASGDVCSTTATTAASAAAAALEQTLDAIEGRPGEGMDNADCSESWTDILFADADSAPIGMEMEVQQEQEQGESRVENDSTKCTSTDSTNINIPVVVREKKTGKPITPLDVPATTAGTATGLASGVDERNPLFQFLASSLVFRTAVYSAIGQPVDTATAGTTGGTTAGTTGGTTAGTSTGTIASAGSTSTAAGAASVARGFPAGSVGEVTLDAGTAAVD